jgi:ubiquinone/menaquinone biosynthesis C-methylase UbiE
MAVRPGPPHRPATLPTTARITPKPTPPTTPLTPAAPTSAPTSAPGPATLTPGMVEAYDLAGTAWEPGPARLVYDRLARVLIARTPVPLAGRVVLDVGGGTGAAARGILAAGGRPVAVDVSLGMLRANTACVGAAMVGDGTQLPVADGSVDGVVAAFSFNHLAEPSAGFREAARVCRPGAPVLAAAFAADDRHPVKQAVDQALGEAGWVPEPWYEAMRSVVVPRLATRQGMLAAAHQGGLVGQADRLVVAVPGLRTDDLVAWRLGLAHTAPFVSRMTPGQRAAVDVRVRLLVGDDPEPLRRSIVVFAGVVPPEAR